MPTETKSTDKKLIHYSKVLFIAILCLLAGAMALWLNTVEEDTPTVVHFPEDRSFGTLTLIDRDLSWKQLRDAVQRKDDTRWKVHDATGSITIPLGKKVIMKFMDGKAIITPTGI